MEAEFTGEEMRTLAPFFTNVDAPVFGLKLPQEVAGALFSRYSRTAKSLRRVFLDEFVGEQGLAAGLLGGSEEDDGEALRRLAPFTTAFSSAMATTPSRSSAARTSRSSASRTWRRKCSRTRGSASVPREVDPLRAVRPARRGRNLWHREQTLLASRHRAAFAALMDRLFSTYAAQIDPMIRHIEEMLPIESVDVRHPKTGEPLAWSDVEGRGAPEGRAPGVRGDGARARVRRHAELPSRRDAHEPRRLRDGTGVRAPPEPPLRDPLAECRVLGTAMHAELGKLIPSFVKRAKRSEWLVDLHARSRRAAARFLPPGAPASPSGAATLLDFDPDGDEKVLAALLYPYPDRPLAEARARVAAMPAGERAALHA